MKGLRFLTIVICCWACALNSLHAQENKPWSGFAIETNVMAGKILKHTGKIKAPVPDLSTAYDFNFIQQTFGKRDWHQRRRYPVVGVGITYTHYGEPYGSCIGIYPNLQFPIIRGKQLEWTLRVGYGIGYATRPYQRLPNFDTLNNAIGSSINNYSSFVTDLRYHVNKHWDVQLGANFSHISNAALRQPNYGINMYGAHIGFRYYPVTAHPERITREVPRLHNRWLAQVRYGMAWNEYAAIDGPLYPVYLLSAYASKRYWSKNKVLLGLDYSYHSAMTAFQKNNEINVGSERQHSWKSAVFLGNEFLYGHVGILIQIGWYLKQAVIPNDKLYQKLGANFYLVQKEKGALKELGVGVFLKTHKAQAELAEFGITAGF